jgi:hypothetical protein
MFSNVEADIPKDNQASESHREVFGLQDFFSLLIVGHKAPQKVNGSFSPLHSNGYGEFDRIGYFELVGTDAILAKVSLCM